LSGVVLYSKIISLLCKKTPKLPPNTIGGGKLTPLHLTKPYFLLVF